MGWLSTQLEGFVKWLFGWLIDGALVIINETIGVLIRPIVGTPGPRSTDGWIVFGTPSNPPWASLYTDVYLAFVVPLALGLLFVALAYLGLGAGTISAYRRQQLTRRLLVAFLAVFFWFPIASVGTQFFDALGVTLALGRGGTEQLASDLGESLKLASGALLLVLVVYAVEVVLLVLAVVAFAIRWLGVIVLTLVMPLLAVVWTFEIWPLDRFAGLAGKAAALYPGLLMAGLPSAILLRIAVEAQFDFGFGGLFGVFVSAALIPAAAVSSAAMILWSSSAVRKAARRSSVVGTATARKTPDAARGAKTSTGRAVRGARNVHRGYTTRGAIRADGTTVFEDGDSRAYRAGKRARQRRRAVSQGIERGAARASEKRADYRFAHDVTGLRKRDVAKRDATGVVHRAGTAARNAARRTSDKLSRW